MTLKFTNNKTKTKDGKHIAYVTMNLIIEGEQYNIRLLTADKRDNKKINNALKAKGFTIGEVGKTQDVLPLTYSLKGE